MSHDMALNSIFDFGGKILAQECLLMTYAKHRKNKDKLSISCKLQLFGIYIYIYKDIQLYIYSGGRVNEFLYDIPHIFFYPPKMSIAFASVV